MSSLILQGRLSHRLRSLATLVGTTAGVLARRAVGRPLVPQWSASFEIGTLFFRHQFNHALRRPDIAEGRACFDSLVMVVDAHPPVLHRPSAPGEPRGDWFIPHRRHGGLTLLYFHGGGYAFYAAVSRHFVAMLAGWLGVPIFAPDYRLTPEHPHPAQIDDALAAWRHLLASGLEPQRVVIGGDSAGGHLALMLAARLGEAGGPQPALVCGLSPWTDIGRRGASQFGHDRYDMVQGWQTLRYGAWLQAGTGLGEADLSPIHRCYRGAAPIYLQAGGKEILVDMIRDFARVQQAQGARVHLDVWPHMTHEFQAYGPTLPQSRQAIERLRAALAWAAGDRAAPLAASPQTEVGGLRPRA